MANRRFEMHHYRNIIVRMRLGESGRALAKAGLIGRRKAKKVRRIAGEQGWLDPSHPLADDATLAEMLGRPSSPNQSISLVLPYQEDVSGWWKQGIAGTTIRFNGVPKKLIIDNPKCAIIRACYHDPEVQRAYAECAEGYGFLISPCPPRDPKKKGRVESGVKYVKWVSTSRK